MTADERKDLIEKASRWTLADLECISVSILAMDLHDCDPEVIELFKRRYQELTGQSWSPGYEGALFDAGKREH